MDNKLQQWKSEILERDDYTCQHCGANTNLDAAHIVSRGAAPDLKYDTRNGLTLCRRCHFHFHESPKAFENFVRVWRAGFANPLAHVDCPPSRHRHAHEDKRFADSRNSRGTRLRQDHFAFTDQWADRVNQSTASQG